MISRCGRQGKALYLDKEKIQDLIDKQPKERTDAVSVNSAEKIAADMRPEEITGTAYNARPLEVVEEGAAGPPSPIGMKSAQTM